jgi:hypothetical protein
VFTHLEVAGRKFCLKSALALLGGLVAVTAAAAPPTGVKNVVSAHGAFADGSGWEPV